MAIAGSPKKFARDIAEGYFSLSAPALKPYTPTDLKTIMTHLAIVARELRSEPIAPEDVLAVKTRNMKLSRINQTEMIIRAHCRKLRIPL